MNFKKLMSITLSSLLLFFNTSFAFAVNFTDLKADHWAYEQIENLSEKGIIKGYPDETYKPDDFVNRAEFTKMIIKTLDKSETEVTEENPFSDISSDFWAYDDILKSYELGLITGYPDNTFRPHNHITKTEATSIISKVIDHTDCEDSVNESPLKEYSVLSQFSDHEEIANWAKGFFSQTIKHEIYVNYPDENYLTPNKSLTRAETAVLLYKLRQDPLLIASDFRGPELQEEEEAITGDIAKKLLIEEYSTIVEHLPVNHYTDNVNEVEIQGPTAVILAYNVLPVRFEGGFKDKKVQEGDLLEFAFTQDVSTQEGTNIIPAGSRLIAEITEFQKGRFFHKNGKMNLEINHLLLPSGKIYPLNAEIENYELFEEKFGKANYKKMGIISGSVATFGTLLGLTVGALSGDVGMGTALGGIIGGGTGILLGLIAPGRSVEISEDEEIFVKFNRDVEIELE